MKFLVWCTSYADTEDDACSVECIPISISDAEYSSRRIVEYTLRGAADAAERYARFVHNQRDGWELTWPLQFRVKHADASRWTARWHRCSRRVGRAQLALGGAT